MGEANFFATVAQFLYNDENPSLAAPGLGINNGNGQSSDNIFQIAYQAGLNYQIATNMSAQDWSHHLYLLRPKEEHR